MFYVLLIKLIFQLLGIGHTPSNSHVDESPVCGSRLLGTCHGSFLKWGCVVLDCSHVSK